MCRFRHQPLAVPQTQLQQHGGFQPLNRVCMCCLIAGSLMSGACPCRVTVEAKTTTKTGFHVFCFSCSVTSSMSQLLPCSPYVASCKQALCLSCITFHLVQILSCIPCAVVAVLGYFHIPASRARAIRPFTLTDFCAQAAGITRVTFAPLMRFLCFVHL